MKAEAEGKRKAHKSGSLCMLLPIGQLVETSLKSAEIELFQHFFLFHKNGFCRFDLARKGKLVLIMDRPPAFLAKKDPAEPVIAAVR